MARQEDRTAKLLAKAKGGNKDAVNNLFKRQHDVLRRQIQLRLDKRIMRRVGVSEPAASMRYLRAMRRLRGLLEVSNLEEH
jgi:RNA polymerase sigma-70 factor (ECF subfamily)